MFRFEILNAKRLFEHPGRLPNRDRWIGDPYAAHERKEHLVHGVLPQYHMEGQEVRFLSWHRQDFFFLLDFLGGVAGAGFFVSAGGCAGGENTDC